MELQVVIWVRSSYPLQNDNTEWNYFNPLALGLSYKAIDFTSVIALSRKLVVLISLRQ
jgi:hypothetical protein